MGSLLQCKLQYNRKTNEYRGYSVICSSVTKRRISDFFVNNLGFKEKVYPAVVNGIRVFSIYQYLKDDDYVAMLILTRNSANRIHRICKGSDNYAKVQLILRTFFSTCIGDIPEKEKLITVLVPTLAMHYCTRNTGEYSIYASGALADNSLCLLYPLSAASDKGLTTFLNRIARHREDSIQKERLFLT